MIDYKDKQYWFQLLGEIYQQTHNLQTGINCITDCDALCCPRLIMPGKRASSHVIFLPYEIEYICDQLQACIEELEISWHKIQWGVDNILRIATFSQCPFLHNEKLCSIYSHRPFDCRSFPIILKSDSGKIGVTVKKSCPYWECLSEDFMNIISCYWNMLLQIIPDSWFILYLSCAEINE